MPADAVMPGMQDREGEHREREDREQMDWAPWAQMRNSWIQNELAATVTMSRTQIQPNVRWGSVPLGAASMQLDGGRSVQQRCKRHGLLTLSRACGIA